MPTIPSCPSGRSRLRATRRAFFLLLAGCTLSVASAGEAVSVNQLGAQLTSERARQLRATGMVDLATGLEQLSEQISTGSISVIHAAALVQLTDSVAAGRRPKYRS